MKIPIENTNLFFYLDTITIKDGDTLIITFDLDYLDLDTGREIYNSLVKIFPSNKIIATLKGVDINSGN